MSPAFLAGLDMLRQMQALTGCCDTQPPVIVYRDRPGLSQPAAAVPAGGDYATWSAFHAGNIREWLTLEQLRAECGRLATVGAPSPELLLSHAMRLLDALAAAVPDGWVLVPKELPRSIADDVENAARMGGFWTAQSLWAACVRLAAAPQVPQQAELWRPIATAPKDAVVLLAAEFDCPGDWRIKCGTWIPEEKAWRVWGASWIPTRWMPLPAPPATPAA